MTDKQINRWLRRRFTGIGWLLMAYYVLMNLLASGTMLVDAAAQMVQGFLSGNPEAALDYDALYSNAWGYILSMGAAFAILQAWKGYDHFKQEIFAREKSIRPSVFLILLCLCMGAQMANSLWISGLEWVLNCFGGSVVPLLEAVSGSSDTFSMFLYASLFAPIFEELLFRGYVLRALQPYGKRFAILCSALLFGFFHGNLLQAPYAFLVGLILGYVTVEYSIVWAMGLHMFNNLVLADLLTRLTMNWSDLAFSLLNMGLFGSAAVASIGILLANRHKIRAYRQSEWMDRRCLKCFFTNSGILVLLIFMALNMLTLFLV